MNWFVTLFTQQSVAQSAIIYALVIAMGIALSKIKILGISFGITWVLFIGLLFSYFGISINKEVGICGCHQSLLVGKHLQLKTALDIY